MFPEGASPYGVLDMSGNVWEWCLTRWRRAYDEPEDNDLGSEALRVVRGGSWFGNLNFARAAYRYLNHPGVRVSGFGFRVVVRP